MIEDQKIFRNVISMGFVWRAKQRILFLIFHSNNKKKMFPFEIDHKNANFFLT